MPRRVHARTATHRSLIHPSKQAHPVTRLKQGCNAGSLQGLPSRLIVPAGLRKRGCARARERRHSGRHRARRLPDRVAARLGWHCPRWQESEHLLVREGVSDSSPEEAPRSPQDGVLLLLPAEKSFGAGQWIETVIRGAGATRARLRRRRPPHPGEGSGAHPQGVARRSAPPTTDWGASSGSTAGRSRPQIAAADPEIGRQPP